jgi:small acid-soluble spore protein I (minor)
LNLNLRQAIMNRVKNKSEAELREIIEDSVGNTEMALPGLGVLFEMIWRDSGEEEREKMVSVLHQSLVRQKLPS